MTLSDQRILVTGASGTLGQQLLYELNKRGLKPIAHVRHSSDCRYIDSLGLEKRFADLRNQNELDHLAQGVDIIIHTAAWVNFRQDRLTQFTGINMFGAVNLYRSAQAADVKRFVHVSTIAAVGALPRQAGQETTPPINENFQFNLGGLNIPYILSKAAAERELLAMSAQGKPELVIVNPSIVVAPSSSGDDRGKALKLFGRSFLPDLPNRINLVDLRDIAPAIVAAAEKGMPQNRYLLAGDNTTVHELVLTVSGILGRTPHLVRIPRAFLNVAARSSAMLARAKGRGKIRFYPDLVKLMDYDWAYSSAKARAELGFRPRSLTATLEDLLTNQFKGTFLVP